MPIVFRYHCEPVDADSARLMTDMLARGAVYRSALVDLENKARFLRRGYKAFADDEVRKAFYGRMNEVCAAAKRAARAKSVDEGLTWGTYQHVEEAVTASVRATHISSDLRYFSPRDTGNIAVHLQPARALQDGDDPWIRIHPGLVRRGSEYMKPTRAARAQGDTRQQPVVGAPRPSRHRLVQLRMGTLESRAPIWADLYVLMHRELPAGKVSWALAKRYRIGSRYKWELHIVIDDEKWAQPVKTAGHAVGVDIGWRRVEGGIRTAVWRGSDGRHGELVIPDQVISKDEKADSLRAIRERSRNELQAEWLAIRETLPEGHWFRVATTALHAWKRTGRYVRLLRQWTETRSSGQKSTQEVNEVECTDNTPAGYSGHWREWHRGHGCNKDPDKGRPGTQSPAQELLTQEAYARATAWAKQDRHLWDWEGAMRQQRERAVLELVRTFAVRLARAYAKIGVEAPFVSEVVTPADGAQDDAKRLAGLAGERVPRVAPAAIRQNIECFAIKYGAKAIRLDPSYTTKDCSSCGHRREEVEDWSKLDIVCARCGVIEDQDVTAAENLCRMASAVVFGADGAVIAGQAMMKIKRKMPARGNRKKAKEMPAQVAET